MITPGSTKLTSAPSLWPITRLEAKDHANITDTGKDVVVDRLIAAAVERAQNYTNRQFILGTYTLTMEDFPKDGGPIWLKWPPLVSVTSVQYTDIAGDTQTWNSSNYVEDTAAEPGKIGLAYQASYPSARVNPGEDNVTIIYKAGYGPTESASVIACPDAVKNAVAMLVTDMYEHRMSSTDFPVHSNRSWQYLLDTVALPEPV